MQNRGFFCYKLLFCNDLYYLFLFQFFFRQDESNTKTKPFIFNRIREIRYNLDHILNPYLSFLHPKGHNNG